MQVEFNSLTLRTGLHESDQFPQDLAEVHGDPMLHKLSRLDLGHIQKILYEIEEGVNLFCSPAYKIPMLAFQGSGKPVEKNTVQLPHGHQRTAQFVGDHVHEVGFHLVQLLEVGDILQNRDRPLHLGFRSHKGSGHSAEDGFPGRDLLDRGLLFRTFSGDDPLEGSEKSLFFQNRAGREGGFHPPGDLQKAHERGVVKDDFQFPVGHHDAIAHTVDDGGDPGLLEGEIVKISAPLLFKKDAPFPRAAVCLPLFEPLIRKGSS